MQNNGKFTIGILLYILAACVVLTILLSMQPEYEVMSRQKISQEAGSNTDTDTFDNTDIAAYILGDTEISTDTQGRTFVNDIINIDFAAGTPESERMEVIDSTGGKIINKHNNFYQIRVSPMQYAALENMCRRTKRYECVEDAYMENPYALTDE